MRGIATDEDAAIAEPIGQHAPADPVLLAQDLIFELQSDTEDQTDAAIAVDSGEVRLIRAQVVVDQPGLAAIDGEHVGAAPRIQRLR